MMYHDNNNIIFIFIPWLGYVANLLNKLSVSYVKA